jgi:hypothetical protein
LSNINKKDRRVFDFTIDAPSTTTSSEDINQTYQRIKKRADDCFNAVQTVKTPGLPVGYKLLDRKRNDNSNDINKAIKSVNSLSNLETSTFNHLLTTGILHTIYTTHVCFYDAIKKIHVTIDVDCSDNFTEKLRYYVVFNNRLLDNKKNDYTTIGGILPLSRLKVSFNAHHRHTTGKCFTESSEDINMNNPHLIKFISDFIVEKIFNACRNYHIHCNGEYIKVDSIIEGNEGNENR